MQLITFLKKFFFSYRACIPAGKCNSKTRASDGVVFHWTSIVQGSFINERKQVTYFLFLVLCHARVFPIVIFSNSPWSCCFLDFVEYLSMPWLSFRLSDVISKLNLQKGSVLRHMASVIQPILEKGIVDHSIIHWVLIEYLSIAGKVKQQFNALNNFKRTNFEAFYFLQ